MACRNDEAADPVGRGRGVAVLPVPPPLPPPGLPPPKPAGGVTPCFSRHCCKDDDCDELDPELEPEELPELELELQPATASTATVATVPSTTGLYTCFLLAARGPRVSSPVRRSQGSGTCDLVAVPSEVPGRLPRDY